MQLINALRRHLAEFGLVVPQGPSPLKQFASLLDSDTAEVSDTVREIARLYLDQIDLLTERIEMLNRQLERVTVMGDTIMGNQPRWRPYTEQAKTSAMTRHDRQLLHHLKEGKLQAAE